MDKRPGEIILELYEARIDWADEAILLELETLPGLPDEYDEQPWFNLNYAWEHEQTQQTFTLYLALADHVRKRKLKAGVRLLLERASFGDFGEIMRGMHHNFEAAFEGSDSELADLCVELMQQPRLGTKLWALEELSRLKDRRAIPELLRALYLPTFMFSTYATMWLQRLYDEFPDEQAAIKFQLEHCIKLHKRKLIGLEATLAEISED